MPFLELDSRHHIHYQRIEGPPNRPCLVFLHEGLGSVDQWKVFPRQLCARTGCPGLVYDRLGYGRSAPFWRPWTIHFLHEYGLFELPRIIDALLPGRPFLLVGHSDGGSISLIFAAGQPSLLLGVITEAAHVFVEGITTAAIRKAAEAFAQGRLTGLGRYHGDKTEDLFRAWSGTWLSRGFAAWNIEYLLPSIEAPLLVLQGRDDQYGTSAQMEAIAAGSAGEATSLLLEACAHAPHLEAAEPTLEHMAAFVNRIRTN
jgi:pimeloyl-ACP methyl ester carboxylesterase